MFGAIRPVLEFEGTSCAFAILVELFKDLFRLDFFVLGRVEDHVVLLHRLG